MKGKSWRDPNWGFAQRDDYPVVCVSWNDGRAFCEWLTKKERESGRLPAGQAFTRAASSTIELKVAVVAGIAIYVLGLRGRLGTALDYRWLQYLGRISYSLYLIHFPVAHVVTTIGHEHMRANDSLNPWAAAACLVAALAACLAAAHLLYTFVEAPSVRFAARFKRHEAAPGAKAVRE
jgi:peptidoglycan/LPS O-acetylase OafA/YrhL